jgi:hypothetical protein
MLRKIAASALTAFALILFALSCSKQTPFGSDLLDDQLADYNFTDTLSMIVSVEREDTSLITTDRNTADYQLCGELNDPIFGKSVAEIYTLMQTGNSAVNFQDTRYRYDSLEMFLNIIDNGIYGDTTQEQTLRIFRLAQAIDTRDSSIYFSNMSLPVDEQVGEVRFFPRPSQSDSLVSTTARGAFVRIKMNDSFGQFLFGLDSLTYTTDSAFERKLRGLKIVCSSGSTPGAMLSFNLNNANFSLMRLHFTRDDTASSVFNYQFLNAKKFMNFRHDYAGTPVESRIGKPAPELVFAQGMGGLRYKVEFPYASKLENIAVNKAELVVTVAEQPGDNPLLFPANQLLTTKWFNDSTFTIIDDVLASIGSTGTLGYGRFGGFPVKKVVNGQSVTQYRFNVTQHFQDLIDNTSTDLNKRTLWFQVSPQARVVSRAVFHGPKSSSFPMKLELKYTNVR